METEVINSTAKSKKIHNKKRFLLSFLLFGISLVTFITATYAWFNGVGTVYVNQFDIEIKTNDDLEISLDGYSWSTSLSISEDLIKDHAHGGIAYTGNTNSWVGDEGIIPVSTSGDNTLGILDIYDKQSLKGTNGGYRISSKQYDNTSGEMPFYVAFDLFVKNNLGDIYKNTYNYDEDEDIYLTKESRVTAIASGATSYGVQNSARVAFVQVGRISLDNVITNTTPSISCNTPGVGDKYTPICDATSNPKSVVIWEPNELSHDTKLINYYGTVCRGKTYSSGEFVYAGGCQVIQNGVYTPTFTIKKTINPSDNVDIYDGLNGYTSTIQVDSNIKSLPLQETITYTDTMKNTYDNENSLFRLHPHSVTKIRVYVYLEGQDVDNYDLAAEDQEILVTFGFTKNSYVNHEVDA